VVTAHPDDVDFGSAGTMAVLADAGVEVTYCLVTDGDAGGSDREMSRADMAALRRAEQTRNRHRRIGSSTPAGSTMRPAHATDVRSTG
jgi:LmbE family N-acetylglucosaminyl deacetylase